MGDVEGQLLATMNLAIVHANAGQIQHARAGFATTRELAHAAGHSDNEALALANLCAILHRSWELDRARASWRCCSPIVRELGHGD